jgi:tetratricopeptide (TPR) repeat protein
MVDDDRGELWIPGEFDLSDPFKLQAAILNVAKLSDEEVTRVVTHLVDAGQYYQAARCLEVVGQERLGLEVPADQVLNPAVPEFGAFHATIFFLIRAGALYNQAKRPKTAATIFRRALIFVEESLRSVERVRSSHNQDLWSVGVTFEMAGHVCVALSDSDGLDYYGAAMQYWDQAVRLRPEEIPQLTYHPVTRTVIGCLEQAAMARNIDENYREILFTPDYQTRIDTARSLLR